MNDRRHQPMPAHYLRVLYRRYRYLTERRHLGNSFDAAEIAALEWVIKHFDQEEEDHGTGQRSQAR